MKFSTILITVKMGSVYKRNELKSNFLSEYFLFQPKSGKDYVNCLQNICIQ